MEIYFYLNARVFQGNVTVLSILHSLKELVFSGRNFNSAIKRNSYVDLVLKTT